MMALVAVAGASIMGDLGPDGDGDGIPDAVELSQGTNPAVKDNDIFASNRLLVMQVYRDFLGREAEPGGLAFWQGQLDGGLDPASFIEQMQAQPEFQARVAPVIRLYLVAFNRRPDHPGLTFWARQFAGGMSLDDIGSYFAASPEFDATYGALTNRQFVELLYMNVLQRPGDVRGVDFWTLELDSGNRTRGQVLVQFSESPENVVGSDPEVLVAMAYAGMLNRTADLDGYDFWVDRVIATSDRQGLIRAFFQSQEYHDRFLPAPAPPVITSANGATFHVGAPGTFTVTATGVPAPALSVSGALPGGVTFDAATGVLSGTPAVGTAGTYPLTFTAANGVPPNAVQAFTLTVSPGVVITSANATTFTVGAAGSFTVTTASAPVAGTISHTGALPAGVSFVNNGNGTATLSGTPAAGTGGTYPITITAANGVGNPGTQDFTLTVNQAPAITSANAATFPIGAAGTHTLTATGFPAPTLSMTGALPTGVTFNAGTGVLSGTPAAGTGGIYALVFTAANGVAPNATQNFTLTVNQPPAITSANAVTFTVGAAGTFTVTTTGVPGGASMTIGATGALPAGVTFVNNGNGTATLSGTPGAGTGGTYPLTITANNGVAPNATQGFTLTVNQAPAITSANATTFTVGAAGTFNVTASGFPAPTYSVSGALPGGVTLSAAGVLSGTPAAGTGGSYPVTLTAANGVAPNATQSFTLTVNQAPAITSANATTFTVGAAGTFTATATGFPAPAVSFSGVPPAIGVGAVGAVLSGTALAGSGGVYNGLLVTAANGVGANATQPFTLTVNEAPTITSANNATFQVGVPGTFTVTASGFPAPTFAITGGALPTGVVLDTNTGVISGTPGAGTAAGSPYAITLGASNGVGSPATQVFTLTVNDPAVAVDDGYNVVHDTVLTVSAPGILANDIGMPAPVVVAVNGSGANVGVPTATANGSVTVNADGSFSYTPNPDTSGPDTFTYGIQNSSGSDTGTVTITVANALPVVDLNGPAAGIDTAPGFTEGGGPVAIVDPAQLTVADADDANLTGATIQLANLLDAGFETIAVTCPDAGPGCSGAILAADLDVSTPGTILIAADAPLADYQALLRTLTYNNASATPNGTVRDVAVTINDGIADNNPVAHAMVSVTAVNNAPVLAGIEAAALAYSVTAPAAAITASLTVSDADSPNLAGATVQVTGNCTSPDDVLGFTPQAGITGVYTGATCLMTLSGSASPASYQAALRSVTYQNANLATSTATRTVSFRVDDGAGVDNLSNIATRDLTVQVNTAPVVNAGGTLSYTENDAPTAIDTTVTVTDTDSPNLVGATVQITTNCTSTEDVLAFSPQNGITGSYSGATCTMTLSGSSTVANYQAALRSVQYSNASENPATTARTVTWQVNDGGAVNNLSNTPTSTINVAAAADAPVLTAGGALAYTENDPATAIDATLTVTDPDSTNLSSATVQITANCGSSEDVLAFTNQNGITGTYTAATCTMALAGSATLANYQAALRSITYSNTSENPNPAARTVTWIGNDGALSSAGVTSTINVTAVNDAPVLASVEAGALAYTENAAPNPITATLTVTDADSANLAGATVQITGNCASGQDVLSFTNQNGITGGYTAATCTMALSGSASVANYQTALRSVAYANSSENPSTLARTVSFQVNDGGAANNLSNTVTRGISVTAVNDAPAATAFAGLPARPSIPITYPAGKLTGTDPEGTALAIDTTPINVTNGTVTVNGDGSFTFTPLPLATTASFQYRVTDSGSPAPNLSSPYATVAFTVTGPAIFFVKNPAVGLANCTLGNECLFGAAITGIGATTGADIFIGDAASHTAGATLNADASVIGQGVVTAQSFAQFFGIATPAEGTLATLPSLNQPRPTVTAAGGTTLTLGANNTLRGFNLTNAGGAGVAGTNFGVLALADMSINTSGQAINLTTGTLAASLDSVTSTGGTNNIALTGVATSGTADLGSGALSGAASNAFALSGQNGSFTYGGTISNATALAVSVQSKTGGTVTFSGDINPSAAARGILVQNNNTGTNAITFSGAQKRISSGANAGVTLTSNAGATISFTNGGLDVATTSGTGFNATGGAAAINITGPANRIGTTAGTALNVNSSSIGASGLTFESISAAGGARGISLVSTGASGGLTVTGIGSTAGSGGTIQNVTARGAEFSGARAISLSNMDFTNACTANGVAVNGVFGNNVGANAAIHLQSVTDVGLANVRINGSAQHGINGNLVTHFTMANSLIQNTGNEVWESGIFIENLRGTSAAGTASSISNTTIQDTGQFNIFVQSDGATNAAGSPASYAAVNRANMDQLTLSGMTFLNSGVSVIGDHVTVFNSGTANFRTVVTNSTFTALVNPSTHTSDNIQVDASSAAHSDFDISGSTFTGAGQSAINVSAAGTGFATFNVHDNPDINARAAVGINVAVNGDSEVRGFIQNNPLMYSNVGNNPAAGINVVVDQTGLGVVSVLNNVITTQPGTPANGFQIGLRGMARNAVGGQLDMTVQNNTVTVANSGTNGFEGFTLDAGNSSPGENVSVCVNLSGNLIDGVNSLDYFFTQYSPNTFRIQGLTGSGASAANVNAFVAATDADPSGTDPTVDVQGGLIVNYVNGTCLIP